MPSWFDGPVPQTNENTISMDQLRIAMPGPRRLSTVENSERLPAFEVFQVPLNFRNGPDINSFFLILLPPALLSARLSLRVQARVCMSNTACGEELVLRPFRNL